MKKINLGINIKVINQVGGFVVKLHSSVLIGGLVIYVYYNNLVLLEIYILDMVQ